MARKKIRQHAHRPRATGPEVLIYGLHAARAALANPARKIVRIWATANAAARIHDDKPAVAPFEVTTARALDAMLTDGAVHQGIVVQALPLPRQTGDHPILLEPRAENGPIVALDQVTDPRNVGAIMRAAAAFGASAMMMTRHHRPPESGVLAKAASGGLEYLPIIEIGNLARTLAELGDRGFHVLGLDSEAPVLLEQIDITTQAVLVMGAEGDGLRRLTRERCETLCRLNTTGVIRSLNVSTAAAVALHALAARRGDGVAD